MAPKKPSRLSRLWEGWKRVAKKIGDVQARIILTLFYIFVVGPFALAIRWFGDPLAIKVGASNGWRRRTSNEPVSIERAAQQF
jgi:hypothetical protein